MVEELGAAHGSLSTTMIRCPRDRSRIDATVAAEARAVLWSVVVASTIGHRGRTLPPGTNLNSTGSIRRCRCRVDDGEADPSFERNVIERRGWLWRLAPHTGVLRRGVAVGNSSASCSVSGLRTDCPDAG